MKQRTEVREKSSFFDTESLPAGHSERFKNRLNQQNKLLKSKITLKFFKIAASVILIFSISGIIFYSSQQHSTQANINQTIKSDSVNINEIEFTEASHYYQSLIDDKLVKIKSADSLEKEIIVDIESDLEEITDYQKNIQTDMQMNHADIRLMNAMIICYKQKIEMLDLVLLKVEQNS